MYAQDGKGLEATAYVKFFNPIGDGTWYITELNPDTMIAFGLTVIHGQRELGYIDLNELKSVKLAFGMYIERDIHFSPKRLEECR